MDEKGYGSIVGTAALVLALLFSFTVFANSFEKTYDQFNEVRDEQNARMVNEIQTDVRIDNVINIDNDLRIIVKNTGSTELNRLNTDLLINGSLYPEENMVKKVDNNFETNIWLPGENLEIRTDNVKKFVKTANRVKVISEFGVSDYEEEIIGGG